MCPMVSIGLPVYNGQKFIGAAIDSILAQTFTDIELIICDNCSTDQTETICRAYAAADPRVRYHRNEQNIGASRNYNLAFSLATGKYFKWATHDDVIQPTYLERCIAVLESDPSVVLCHSQTQIIDEFGQPVGAKAVREFIQDANGQPLQVGLDSSGRKLRSTRADERFHGIILDTLWCYEIFGVMRADVLGKTTLQEHFYGTDKVLLAEMSALGQFAEVPEPLFLNRRHPANSGNLKTAKEREVWNAPLAKRHFPFPRLLCLKGYLRVALRSPMSLSERIGCFAVITHYATQTRRWRSLLREFRKSRALKAEHRRQEMDNPIRKLS